MHDAYFETLWSSHGDFTLRTAVPRHCIYAEKFAIWADALCQRVATEQSIITVNQAKVQLVDKYFEWRRIVPKPHRNRLSHSDGHGCIFHVFQTAYDRIKVVELSITPPLLFEPHRPALPAPPQIAGIFVGELDEGKED